MFATIEDKKDNDFKLLNEYWKRRNEFRSLPDEIKYNKNTLYSPGSILEGIEKTIADSTDQQKQLIHLYYEEKLEYADIADELYIKVSQVKKLHKRVIERFAENICFI